MTWVGKLIEASLTMVGVIVMSWLVFLLSLFFLLIPISWHEYFNTEILRNDYRWIVSVATVASGLLLLILLLRAAWRSLTALGKRLLERWGESLMRDQILESLMPTEQGYLYPLFDEGLTRITIGGPNDIIDSLLQKDILEQLPVGNASYYERTYVVQQWARDLLSEDVGRFLPDGPSNPVAPDVNRSRVGECRAYS